MSGMLAGRAPALLRSGRRFPAPTSLAGRSLSPRAGNSSAALRARNSQSRLHQKRLFSNSRVRASATAADPQNPPSSQAYIDSGVVKAVADVNVKKVLVIGSGGLSIGQAGEFDYSGSYPECAIGPSLPTAMSHASTWPAAS